MNFSRATLLLLVVILISGIDAKKKKLRKEVNNIYMLFTGREPVLKTKGTVFPYTDRPRQVNNIFIFFPTFTSLQINLERLSERAY